MSKLVERIEELLAQAKSEAAATVTGGGLNEAAVKEATEKAFTDVRFLVSSYSQAVDDVTGRKTLQEAESERLDNARRILWEKVSEYLKDIQSGTFFGDMKDINTGLSD